MAALDLRIHGRVQGVFFRDWTIATARSLGIDGWVRNEADGTVAAHLEGEAEAVRRMVERMGEGPPAARVDRIEVEVCEEEGMTGFTRR